MSTLEALKFDIEPKRILISSEPYVIYTVRGYQAVVDIIEMKRKKEYLMYIGSASLAKPLELLIRENNNKATGLELWIRKETPEKTSKYIIEE